MFSNILANKKIYCYITDNLKSSLSSIGFSKKLIHNLIINFNTLDAYKFGKEHSKELHKIHSVGFFQKLVPQYFSKNIIPEIQASNKILDLGCGTGILAKILAEKKDFKHIIGVDLRQYPEWKKFKNSKITFKIVPEKKIFNFLLKEKPDTVILTWVLHHMKPKEQERYLEYLYKILLPGARLIILEDSYSTILKPENGANIYRSFMKFGPKDRQNIMGIFDWVANKILAQRHKATIPFTYRTLEEWKKVLIKKGFIVVKEKFIGFPANRDINTPQSLIVATK